jgi:hypothetical protein
MTALQTSVYRPSWAQSNRLKSSGTPWKEGSRQLRADKLVVLGLVPSLSTETVRQALKKTTFNPGSSRLGASRPKVAYISSPFPELSFAQSLFLTNHSLTRLDISPPTIRPPSVLGGRIVGGRADLPDAPLEGRSAPHRADQAEKRGGSWGKMGMRLEPLNSRVPGVLSHRPSLIGSPHQNDRVALLVAQLQKFLHGPRVVPRFPFRGGQNAIHGIRGVGNVP